MLLLVQLPASREGEDEGGDKDVVVVTGGMDLIGRVCGVVGLAGKIQVRQGGHGPRFSLPNAAVGGATLLLGLLVGD